MSLFANAWAQQPAPVAGGSPFDLLIMIGLFFLIIYFIIIRPQNKRTKKQKEMIAALAIGDEVVTNGGVLGKIKNIDATFVVLEIDKQACMTVQKQAISALMPKGTYKSRGTVSPQKS